MKIILVEVERKCVLLNIEIQNIENKYILLLIKYNMNVQVVEFCNIWLTMSDRYIINDM